MIYRYIQQRRNPVCVCVSDIFGVISLGHGVVRRVKRGPFFCHKVSFRVRSRAAPETVSILAQQVCYHNVDGISFVFSDIFGC